MYSVFLIMLVHASEVNVCVLLRMLSTRVRRFVAGGTDKFSR